MAEIHPGNQALQEIVRQYVPQYHACRARKEKNRITHEIVQLAYSKGIRFLRRDMFDNWIEADAETIRVRVGQSLRYLKKIESKKNVTSGDDSVPQQITSSQDPTSFNEDKTTKGFGFRRNSFLLGCRNTAGVEEPFPAPESPSRQQRRDSFKMDCDSLNMSTDFGMECEIEPTAEDLMNNLDIGNEVVVSVAESSAAVREGRRESRRGSFLRLAETLPEDAAFTEDLSTEFALNDIASSNGPQARRGSRRGSFLSFAEPLSEDLMSADGMENDVLTPSAEDQQIARAAQKMGRRGSRRGSFLQFMGWHRSERNLGADNHRNRCDSFKMDRAFLDTRSGDLAMEYEIDPLQFSEEFSLYGSHEFRTSNPVDSKKRMEPLRRSV